MLTDDAVLLVDWLNLSINLKTQRLMFGADLVADLMKLAQDQCDKDGKLRMARAHFVAENYSPAVRKAIDSTLGTKRHTTRTAKEQADLLLAVLAMDHIHDSNGCPRLFLLATGDQDFIPLIDRIVDEGAQVALIVGSTAKLSPDYKMIAAQRNVILLPINEIFHLRPLPPTSGDRAAGIVLGLLRACMSGGVLGGRQDKNIELLSDLGILTPGGDHEVEMASLINQFGKVEHRTAAVPGRSATGNAARPLRRTMLNFALPAVAEVVADADWVLRRIGTARKPPALGDLGLGRFTDDDGTRLDRVVAALKRVDWVKERPDEHFEASLRYPSDGLLEPLWRIVCEVNRRAYDQHSAGVARDDLFNDMRSTPIAHDGERKGGRAASEAIEVARCLGVIDTILVGRDGYAVAVIDSHPVARQAADFLRALGQVLGPDVGRAVPEFEILNRMRERDEESSRPVFGVDVRDRARVLRVLRRAGLAERTAGSEPRLKLKHSAWLRTLLA